MTSTLFPKVLAALMFLVTACAPEGMASGPCSTSADCASGQSCIDGRCQASGDSGLRDGGGFDSGGAGAVTALAITPPDPVVVTMNGMPASIELDLEATFEDGSSALVPGFFGVASTALGAINTTTGTYTANGAAAGTVEVTAEAFGMMVTTNVTVEVRYEIFGEGVPTDAPDRFAAGGAADPAREANVLYPLEGVVFPENVFPADVHWERGVAGDLFRLTITTTGVNVVAYLIHSGAGFGNHWLTDAAAWRALAESAPETNVTLTLDRYEAASSMVITGPPRTLRFADAVIRGAIYYWDLGGGRIVRIRGDGTGLEDFMPSPPPRPADGRRCVACHAISRDGRKMAAELWDGGDFGAIFDLTADLTGDPAPTLVAPGAQRFLTATFSPDTTRLVGSYGNELFLMDGATGGRLTPSGTPLPTAGSAHPSWSPDGTAVAYVSNTNGGWAVDFTRGDLSLVPVTAADTFGASATILSGAPLTVARPTWSPDSQWIGFQHGQHSRAFQDPGGGAPSVRRDATIRMVHRDGTAPLDLAALNGGASNSYYPTFSPFDEGGYFWLAFFSTRDYGNAEVGTRGTGRRQLWVSAISSAPSAVADPSKPAYWLPQQNVASQNMAAFWAEEPCSAEGRTCAVSAECCSGFCRDRGDGPVCVPPDEVPCSMIGEACGGDADCCVDAGSCLGGVCSVLM